MSSSSPSAHLVDLFFCLGPDHVRNGADGQPRLQFCQTAMIKTLSANCRRSARQIPRAASVPRSASLPRRLPAASRRAIHAGSQQPLPPRVYPSTGFELLDPATKIEEELLPAYAAQKYYPAVIGEVLRGRYQIVGKVGFSNDATHWLCRDLV
jgi:hypothetical protein